MARTPATETSVPEPPRPATKSSGPGFSYSRTLSALTNPTVESDRYAVSIMGSRSALVMVLFKLSHSNANCPNRPSQNEFRKRVRCQCGMRVAEHPESGAKATALQTLARLPDVLESREAFGLRRVHRRYSPIASAKSGKRPPSSRPNSYLRAPLNAPGRHPHLDTVKFCRSPPAATHFILPP